MEKQQPEKKSSVCVLMDGRKVVEFTNSLSLPIRTHRPRKYIVCDLEDGNLWRVDDEDPTKVLEATAADRRLMRKILGQRYRR